MYDYLTNIAAVVVRFQASYYSHRPDLFKTPFYEGYSNCIYLKLVENRTSVRKSSPLDNTRAVYLSKLFHWVLSSYIELIVKPTKKYTTVYSFFLTVLINNIVQ